MIRNISESVYDQTTASPWRGVALSTVVLLVGSLVPSPLRRRQEWAYLGPDKLLHLVGHAVYAVTLAEAFGTDRCTDRNAAIVAVSISTIHSLVTGTLQRWVPGRAFEPADIGAGFIGSVLAASGWYMASYTAEPADGSGRRQSTANVRSSTTALSEGSSTLGS
jgi:VanZ family protein